MSRTSRARLAYEGFDFPGKRPLTCIVHDNRVLYGQYRSSVDGDKHSASPPELIEDRKMIENVTTQTLAEANINRRRHVRIAGPFEGFRVGALETPLSIFDLSRGGCFVNAMHEQASGIRFVMKIDSAARWPDQGESRNTASAKRIWVRRALR